MTDRVSDELSEFTWYSRLAAWIGAAMLLVQSILGRDAGPITVLAVLLLGIGFVCFLVGLAIDSRLPGLELLLGPLTEEQASVAIPARVVPPPMEVQPPSDVPSTTTNERPVAPPRERVKPREPAATPEVMPVISATRRPKFRERSKKQEKLAESTVEVAPVREPPPQPMVEAAAPAVEAPSVGVSTEMLGPTGVAVGAQCPRCESTLRVGQLVAECPICGRTHHAICWMENQFHCGGPKCSGHGNLEAPVESRDPMDVPSE